MRLVIFGASGQVGQELVAQCAKSKMDVVAIDRTQCDIRDLAQVRATFEVAKPTAVVNTAAYTAVDLAEREPEAAFSINRDGPLNLAGICKAYGLPLIHLSTDYVFDGTKQEPYLECDAISPINVYGESKHAGDNAIRSTVDEHIIIRTAWVYGCHGRNFLKTMLDLAKTRGEWSVVSDQLGNPTCTVDLAHALMAAAKEASGRQARWGTYHFAGNGDTTWFDFALEIVSSQQSFTGLIPTVRPISAKDYPTAAKRPENSRLKSDLFEATFGIRAAPWQSRVHETVSALLRV